MRSVMHVVFVRMRGCVANYLIVLYDLRILVSGRLHSVTLKILGRKLLRSL